MSMSRVWVASAAAAVCSLWSSVASANFSASPDPAPLGSNVVVDGVGGTTSSLTVTITHNGTTSETLQALVKPISTNCDPYTLTVMAPGLPWTTGVAGATRDVNVVFDPVIRGLRTCTVSMRDAGDVEIGTFVLYGTGVAPELDVSPTRLVRRRCRRRRLRHAVTFDIQNTGNADLVDRRHHPRRRPPATYSISARHRAHRRPPARHRHRHVQPAAEGARSATATVIGRRDRRWTSSTSTASARSRCIATPPPIRSLRQLARPRSPPVRTSRSRTTATPAHLQTPRSPAGMAGSSSPQPARRLRRHDGDCDFAPDIIIARRAVPERRDPLPAAVDADRPRSAAVSFTSNSVGGDNQVTVTCTATKPDISVTPAVLRLHQDARSPAAPPPRRSP